MELMVPQLPKSNQGHGFVVHTSENNVEQRKHKIGCFNLFKTEAKNW